MSVLELLLGERNSILYVVHIYMYMYPISPVHMYTTFNVLYGTCTLSLTKYDDGLSIT